MPGSKDVQYSLKQDWQGRFHVMARRSKPAEGSGDFKWGRWRRPSALEENEVQKLIFDINSRISKESRGFRLGLRRTWDRKLLLLMAPRGNVLSNHDGWFVFRNGNLGSALLLQNALQGSSMLWEE